MTVQHPDKIIYKGKEYDLETNPLESYFSRFPHKLPESECWCSGLWRGYVATFEIMDNQLFLKDIEIMLSGYTKDEQGIYHIRWKSVMNDVFPNHKLLKLAW